MPRPSLAGVLVPMARFYEGVLDVAVRPVWCACAASPRPHPARLVAAPTLMPIIADLRKGESRAREELARLWRYKWAIVGVLVAVLAAVRCSVAHFLPRSWRSSCGCSL